MKITNYQRIVQAVLILATTLLLCNDVQGGAGGVLRGNKRVLSRIESSSTNANEAVDTSLNARLLEGDVKPHSNNGKGKKQKNGKKKNKGDEDVDDDDNASEENNNNNDNQNSSPTVVPQTDDEADDNLIAEKESEKIQAVDVENIVAGSDEDDYYNVKDGQASKSEDNEITDDDKILDIDAEEEAKEVEDVTPEPTIEATIAPTIKTSSPVMVTSSPTKSPTVSPTIATPAPTTSSPTKSPTTSPTKATPSPTKLVTILKTSSPTKKVTARPTRKVTAEPTKIAVIDDGDDGDDDGYQSTISEVKGIDDTEFEVDDDRSFPSELKPIKNIEDIYDHLSPEEIDFLKHMERVDEEEEAAKISIVYFFITAALMVFTAHQLSENPDGVYSSICRLMITVTGVFFKIILLPARKFGWIGSKSGYAHHLVTTQTDFKDPYSRTNRMEII